VAEPLTKTYERWRAGMIKSRLGLQKSTPLQMNEPRLLSPDLKVTGTAVPSRLTDPTHNPGGAPCHPSSRGRHNNDGEDNVAARRFVLEVHFIASSFLRIFCFLLSSIGQQRETFVGSRAGRRDQPTPVRRTIDRRRHLFASPITNNDKSTWHNFISSFIHSS
jgi:hypothetical protein